LPAMVVNGNAFLREQRGACEAIASKPAPTECAELKYISVLAPIPDGKALKTSLFPSTHDTVGAGLPAMVVNENVLSQE